MTISICRELIQSYSKCCDGTKYNFNTGLQGILNLASNVGSWSIKCSSLKLFHIKWLIR